MCNTEEFGYLPPLPRFSNASPAVVPSSGQEEKHWISNNQRPMLWPEHERNTVAMPLTVESVAPAASDAAIASLHQLLGDRLSTAASVREQHGKDASYRPPSAPPDAVAFAQSIEEVSEIVKICALTQGADDPVWGRHVAGGPCGELP
jgi:hypothetical protein